MKFGAKAVVILLVMAGEGAFATHPLITDDAGTVGKGVCQFEFIGEFWRDQEDGATEEGVEISTGPFVSYGLGERVDIVFSLPYNAIRTKDNSGAGEKVCGIGDATIELKAQIFQGKDLSVAIKPGLLVPTGAEEKGLGNGKISYSGCLITTKEAAPWAFHFNAGYAHNEYEIETDAETSRTGIWHVTLATQVEAGAGLSLVTNIGVERDSDRTSDSNPAFILGGIVYSINDRFDIDAGVKFGLTRSESDSSVLAGITLTL